MELATPAWGKQSTTIPDRPFEQEERQVPSLVRTAARRRYDGGLTCAEE
jgi:hypothetical protein